MPKYSIIIPVYNVEKYIKKCLDSVINQTYKDFEVIVVNDGTKDNSMEIVKDYDVKIITQENQGLSAARNRGVQEAKGEYLIFVDSDDYLDKDLLKELNQSMKNHPDLVRFQMREVLEETSEEIDYKESAFYDKNGVEAFSLICKYHFVEPACAYAIRTKYYKENHFEFKKNTVHEDFGLIPLVIIKAKIVNSISYIGYNYVQRQGSIMNNTNYEKTRKKIADILTHYEYLEKEINKTKLDSKVFKSYIANSLISYTKNIQNKQDRKDYIEKLKKLNISDCLLKDTLTRKIKYFVCKYSLDLYIKLL